MKRRRQNLQTRIMAFVMTLALLGVTFYSDYAVAFAGDLDEVTASMEEMREAADEPEVTVEENNTVVDEGSEAAEPGDENVVSDETAGTSVDEGSVEDTEAADASESETESEADETTDETSATAEDENTSETVDEEQSEETESVEATEEDEETVETEETEAETETETETEETEETEETLETETIEFEEYTIYFEAGEGGSVSVSSYTVSSEEDEENIPSVSASADNGYVFVNWTKDGSNYSSSSSITPDAEEATYTANFEMDYPAASFEGGTSTVNVYASVDKGVFPAGTTMRVSAVRSSKAEDIKDKADDMLGEEETVVDIVAVDISFYYNGSEIQPKDASKVYVSMSLKNKLVEGDSFEVVHVDDNDNVSSVGGASDKAASFVSDSFSIYAIIGITPNGDKNLRIYKFYVGDELVDTQNIKSGEKLVQPGSPTKDGFALRGWALENNTLVEFDKEIEFTNEAPETINVHASFVNAYYVFFMNADKDETGNYTYENINTSVMLTAEAIEGKSQTEIDANDITVEGLGSTEAVTGWYKDQAFTQKVDKVKFTDLTADLTLYPQIQTGHYLTFVTDENNKATYIKPQFVAVDGVTQRPADPSMTGFEFAGWSTDKDAEFVPGSTTYNKLSGTPSSTETDIYGYQNNQYVELYYGKRSNNNSSSNKWRVKSSQNSYSGTYYKKVTSETVSFDEFVFGTALSSDLTIYAVWRPQSTTYTVIYWKEPITDIYDPETQTVTNKDHDKYDYWQSASKTASAGTTVNGADQKIEADEGFYYADADSNVTVAGDGTTIVNVYYDRDVMTVDFKTYQETYTVATNNNGTQYGIVDGEYVELDYDWDSDYTGRYWWYQTDEWHVYTGTRYKKSTTGSWQTYRKFVGLYGQPLSMYNYEWPNEYWWYASNNGGSATGTRLTFLDAFLFKGLSGVSNDGKTLTQYGTKSSGTNHIYFYQQDVDNTNNYTLTETVSTGSGTFGITDKYTGFEAYQYSTNGTSWTPAKNSSGNYVSGISYTNLYIRFNRKTYTLDFYNYDGTMSGKQKSLLYGASLSSYGDGGADYLKLTDAEMPAEYQGKGYTFTGWYKDKECTQKFDFNTTMPANNIVVYAGWKVPEVSAKVYLTVEGVDDKAVTMELEYGKKLDATKLPKVVDAAGNQLVAGNSDKVVVVPNGYKWIGWSTKNSGNRFITYNFNEIVFQSIVLYPYYVDNSYYTVVYDKGEGTGTVPTDDNSYQENATVTNVKDGSNLKQGTHVFLYWKTATGEKIYPGDQLVIAKNYANSRNEIVLTAVYGDIVPRTKVTYHSNYPSGTNLTNKDHLVDALMNNAIYTLENPGSIGFTTPTGYEFKGWSTSANGSVRWDAGVRVGVDNLSDNNELYAIWAPITYTVEVSAIAKTVQYNGQTQTVNSEFNFTIKNKNDVIYTGTSVNREVKFTLNNTQYVATANVFGTGKDVGTYTNQIKVQNFKLEGLSTELKSNTPADLTITAIDVTVKVKGNTASYDFNGQPQSVEGYTVVSISNSLYTEADFKFTGTAKRTETNAGTYSMGLKKEQFTNLKTKNFNVTFEVVSDGSLEIKKVDTKVTVTGNTAKKVYSGGKQSVTGYVVTSTNTLYKTSYVSGPAQTAAKAEGTDVGTYPMGLTEDQFTYANDNFNVTFELKDGSLEITPVTDQVIVTIEGNTVTATYDGEEHTVSGYTVKSISNSKYTDADFEFTPGTISVTKIDAGTYALGLAGSQFKNNSTNFTNVKFNVTDGSLVINKATVSVSITGNNHTDDYDGEEHTITGYEVTIPEGSLYTKGDITFSGTAEAKRTDAGTTNMNLTAGQFGNKNGNFDVTFVIAADGYQKINKITAAVTIKGHYSSVTYDGKEHSISGYDVEVSNSLLPKTAVTFSGTAEAKRTDAGKTGMGLKAEQFGINNNNFENVTFSITDGYQEIVPVDEVVVTITGTTATTDYDGQKHSVSGYKFESSNDLYKESYVKFTPANGVTLENGKPVAGGTDAGEYTMGLTPEQFTNTNGNFKTVKFTVNDGKQTISPISVTVTITGANNTTDYDGTAHSVSGYTASTESALYDVTKDFTFTPAAGMTLVDGKPVATRTDAGTTNMGLAEDQFANTNNNFATVTFNVTDGYQTIDPIDVVVTIVGKNSTVDYDGKQHTVSGYTASASTNLYKVTGDKVDFTFSGTAEAKRTDAGTTNMGLADSQFKNANGNFGTVTFNVTDGYQTIKPIDITVTITGANNTTNYDGENHTVTGYTASASSKLYDVTKDFTFTPATGMTLVNGKPVATQKDAGTKNMGLAADQFKNTNGNFGTVTFAVTDGYQTIKPINVTVTITGHNNSANYDGAEHSVSGYDAAYSTDLYTSADYTFNGNATAARTNVVEDDDTTGKTMMGLAPGQFANTNNNFATVTFNVTDGYQEIKPINVTVTIKGDTNSTNYDGEEHSVTGFTATANNSLYDTEGEDRFFTFNGNASASRTNVVEGTDTTGKTMMGLTSGQFANRNSNFATVTFEIEQDGYQEIKPITETVTIKGHYNTATYDGKDHTVTGYDVEIPEGSLYKEGDFTFSGEATATQKSVGTKNMELDESQFENKNGNFSKVTFEITDGYQTITAVEEVVVTIAGHTSTLPYDGTEHSVSGYDVVSISNSLYTEADFTFSGTASASRTDAGTATMGLNKGQFTNTNTNFAKVTFNVTDGYQTISPINVTVTIVGANNTSDYDGTSHVVSGYTATADNTLYKVTGETVDFTFSGTASASRTDAGTTNMNLAADQFANTNPNFGTVTFNVTDGYQTIDPIDVTVTVVGSNSTVDYDGQPHSVTGYTATVADEKLKDLYDVTKDFTFTPAEGMNLVEGKVAATRTNAGTTNMNLAASQFKNTNDNFANVTFSITDGYQTINPINVTVTITGATNEAPYDGKAHTVKGYTAEVKDATLANLYNVDTDFTFTPAEGMNLVDGQPAATRTNVVEDEDTTGKTMMGLAPGQFANINANFATVTFDVNDGYQKINPIDVIVTVVGANSTKDYDGEEHSITGYTASASNELYKVDVENSNTDFTFSGTAEAVRTEAGTTDMGLASGQFANTNPNFGTVTFNVTDGYMTIEPISVTVTIVGNNNTTTYDGEDHTVTGYTATASNDLYKTDVANNDIDFVFNGTASATRKDEGTTNMNLAKSQFANNNKNFKDVEFNVTDGYQTITPVGKVVVTITGNNNTTDYDGQPHSVSGYTAKANNSLYDVDKDFTFSGPKGTEARTDAGTTNMGLNKGQFTNTNSNFADVEFNVTDGYQTINPIDVTVTIVGDSNTTDYNGEVHTVSGYTATASNDLYDVSKDFTFTPAQGMQMVDGKPVATRTNVVEDGDNDGQTDMGLAREQFTNTNQNFDVVTFNVTDGYQKINPIDATVTIVGHKDSKVYNREEQSVTGYDVTAISTDLFTEDDIIFTGEAEAKGTDVKTYPMGLADTQFSTENPNFATVTFNVTDGELEITPVTDEIVVTITGHNNTAPYDSAKHIIRGYDVVIPEGSLYKEADFTFSGTAIAERTNVVEGEDEDGQTDMGLAEAQFTNTNKNFTNVKFSVTDGFQKITPIDVTVTIEGNTKTVDYNGKEQKVEGYEVTSISNSLFKESDITFTGKAEAKGTNADTYKMNLASSQFSTENTNFGTVTFNVVTDGKLIINKINATVTITGKYDSSPYDGKLHTVEGYDAEADTTLYDVTKDFSFNGNQVATRTDVVENGDTDGKTNMGLAPEQFTNTNPNFDVVTFNVTDGYQEITPINATVTITGDVVTATYDKEEHKAVGFTAEASTNLYDVNKDFTFNTNYFGLTIEEGKPIAKRTRAGKTSMNLAADQFKNTNTNFASVKFEVTDGYVEIAKVDEVIVTIIGHNNTAAYDGEEHEVGGYDVQISNPLYTTADFKFNGTAVAKRTNVVEGEDKTGKTMMGLKPGDFENLNPDDFAKVTFKVTDGYQAITPIDVTVTITGDVQKDIVYDATEHTASGYEPTTESNLYKVTGDKVDFTFSGNDEVTRENVGKTSMNLAADQFKNTNPNFDTVTFLVTDGYVEIKPLEVTVVVPDAEKTYDGADFTATQYAGMIEKIVYDGLITALKVPNSSVVIAIPEGIKDAGTYEDKVTVHTDTKITKQDGTEVSYTIMAADGSYDKTANVVLTVDKGDLKINKRKVTMTSGDAERAYYDGTALTNDTVTETKDGFVEGEGATYDVTGKQILVGSSSNYFTYELKKGTKADNYEITPVYGTLTVKNDELNEITVKSQDASFEYNGLPHTISEAYEDENDRYILTGELWPGDYLVVTYDGEITEVSENKVGNNTIKSIKVYHRMSSTSTEEAEPTQSAIGSLFRMTAYAADDADVTECYDITEKYGTLTITSKRLVITANNAEKYYDGKPVTSEDILFLGDEEKQFTVEGLLDGTNNTPKHDLDAEVDVLKNVTASKEKATFVVHENEEITSVKITDEQGNVVANNNYSIVYEPGDAVVTKDDRFQLVLNLKANSGSFTYSGSPYTVSGHIRSVTLAEEVNEDLEEYVNEVISTLNANISEFQVNKVTDEETVAVNASRTETESGSYTVPFNAGQDGVHIIDQNGYDVTEFFEFYDEDKKLKRINYINGTLFIAAPGGIDDTPDRDDDTAEEEEGSVLGANRGIETTTENDPVEGEVLGAGRGKSPKTNDASNAVLWALVMGSSTLGLAALMSKKRREEEQ